MRHSIILLNKQHIYLFKEEEKIISGWGDQVKNGQKGNI